MRRWLPPTEQTPSDGLSCSKSCWTRSRHASPARNHADQIADVLPKQAWQRMSAGTGAKGFRYDDWAFITLPPAADRHAGHHWLLIRRDRTTGEPAFYRCWSPELVAPHQLVAVAGRRWSIEESFQATKTGLGLDQHQHRRWKAWHRWITLVIAARAFLAAIPLEC